MMYGNMQDTNKSTSFIGEKILQWRNVQNICYKIIFISTERVKITCVWILNFS